MIRTTITIDEALAAEIDRYAADANIANRSEAIRDLVRRGLNALPTPDPGADCIGVVSCAVDQTLPEPARRLREVRMGRHDEILFTTSVPVNHSETIDIAIVRGTVGRVGEFARGLFQERGVRHGSLSLTPVSEEMEFHSHGSGPAHAHAHMRVQDSF